MKDIGEDCYQYAHEKLKDTFKGLTSLYPPILEDELAQSYRDLHRKQAKADALKSKMAVRKLAADSKSKRKMKKKVDESNTLQRAIEEAQSRLRTLESQTCWL